MTQFVSVSLEVRSTATQLPGATATSALVVPPDSSNDSPVAENALPL
jgi:hypothetical protein